MYRQHEAEKDQLNMCSDNQKLRSSVLEFPPSKKNKSTKNTQTKKQHKLYQGNKKLKLTLERK